MISMVSCSESALERDAKSDMTEEIVFSDGFYAEQFFVNLYSKLPNGFSENYYWDCISDNAESRDYYAWPQNINNGSYDATYLPGSFSVWSSMYANIRDCNKYLENRAKIIPNAASYYLNSQYYIDQSEFEARLLRALFYFQLVRDYGGVPIILESYDNKDDPGLLKPRDSFKDCIKFIVDECDIAIGTLPPSQPTTYYGRLTKGAAMALKSRALLYAASPLFNGASPFPGNSLIAYESFDNQRWIDAAQAAKDVIMLGTYKLNKISATPSGNASKYYSPDPADGFYKLFIARTNPELIFSYLRATTSSVEDKQLPASITNVGTDKSFCLPTYNLVAAFEMKNSGQLPVTGFQEAVDGEGHSYFIETINPLATDYNPAKPYDGRDPRFYHTIWYDGSTWYDRTFNIYRGETQEIANGKEFLQGQGHTGFFMRKFMSINDVAPAAQGLTGVANHNFPTFRYAEILLNFAEAMNEAYGPENAALGSIIDFGGLDVSTALKSVNAIRNRVTMPLIPSGISKDDLRKRIQRERRVELAFEDQRYWDIRRWKLVEDPSEMTNTIMTHEKVIKADNSKIVKVMLWEQRNFDKKMYFKPIPYNDIQITGIIQNPDW
ncbi:MAG: RagB/SusD family nutrient uptake outer membrane protein [Bacteroidia bacterium]|nr:RagB/SusD family nutrient uptake outer membrane protein [Bacteroidia bacterium]